MRKLHLEKKGLRGLVIAESFTKNSEKSILAGVVMRRDFVIDGFVFGKTTLEGDDATETILSMYKKLNRPDISYLLISGIIISIALANTGRLAMRHSIRGEPRGPVCGMGICFECRASIDGRQHARSCMIICVDGMEVVTRHA